MVTARVAAAAFLLFCAALCNAAVTARVDRQTVELNESFMLEITVDNPSGATPDLSVLEQDFYVGPGSELESTSIVNGRMSRTRTFSYVLMAKEPGTQTIPPIRVGNESSEAIGIVVEEMTEAPPGEADVFITAEVEKAETWVQAQVLYRIKVYRAVPTRQHTLREPVFGGAEALVEKVGDELSYEAVLNGRAYNVNERVYAVFPQESGEVSISPARFEARVLKDGRITGRKLFESEPKTVTVKPVPLPPPELADAAWLPAKELEIREDWSRPPERLTAGEPVTRSVTISALGLLETQIPAMEPEAGAGVNVYPDQPELKRIVEAGGIRGERTDQYALIGVQPGSIRLPAVSVPWWDVDDGEWRVARLPEKVIGVEAADEPLGPEPVAEMPVETAAAEEPGVLTVQSRFWRRISEALAVAWLLTLAAWWWSARPRREREAVSEAPPAYRRQGRVLKEARRAAADGDAATARAALLEWAANEWPSNAPRSLGGIARRVAEPLRSEIEALSRASYGPERAGWDGSGLAAALRAPAIAREDDSALHGAELPPLMPRA